MSLGEYANECRQKRDQKTVPAAFRNQNGRRRETMKKHQKNVET